MIYYFGFSSTECQGHSGFQTFLFCYLFESKFLCKLSKYVKYINIYVCIYLLKQCNNSKNSDTITSSNPFMPTYISYCIVLFSCIIMHCGKNMTHCACVCVCYRGRERETSTQRTADPNNPLSTSIHIYFLGGAPLLSWQRPE